MLAGMSTFDPGLEPPGDWQTPPGPYDDPQGPSLRTARAAAMAVWFCAGAGLVLSSCCVMSAVAFSATPPDELFRQLPSQVPIDEFRKALPVVTAAFAAIGVGLFFLPSIVLAVLGFKIRSAKPKACTAVRVILACQSGVAALFILLILLGMPTSGVTPNALVVLLIIGGYMGLTVRAFRRVGAVQSHPVSDRHPQPWEV